MPWVGYGVLYSMIQFRCNHEMPSMIYQACVATDTPSRTRYCQEAVVEKLSRDLGLDQEDLLAMLPDTRHRGKALFHDSTRRNPARSGSGGNTIEEVV